MKQLKKNLTHFSVRIIFLFILIQTTLCNNQYMYSLNLITDIQTNCFKNFPFYPLCSLSQGDNFSYILALKSAEAITVY